MTVAIPVVSDGGIDHAEDGLLDDMLLPGDLSRSGEWQEQEAGEQSTIHDVAAGDCKVWTNPAASGIHGNPYAEAFASLEHFSTEYCHEVAQCFPVFAHGVTGWCR